jgi:hypothetical protein
MRARPAQSECFTCGHNVLRGYFIPPAALHIEVVVRHRVLIPHPCDLAECADDLSQPHRLFGQHDRAFAREAEWAVQIIALVSASGAAFANAVFRPDKD